MRTICVTILATSVAFAAFVTCAEPVVKVEKKPWGADYTLVDRKSVV